MPSFQNADTSFFGEADGGPVRVAVDPASGSTITMKAAERDLYITHGSTIAALTVKLPLGAQPGEYFELAGNCAVTTLTINDGFGVAVSGAPTALVANTAIILRWVSDSLKWKLWK